ncbi:MAG: hypothetical protein GKR89_32990 [Candidatus Latescibacteria bacterium]|nr:hypothetical protein [Candidatus Latescibacterota bacterium]
MAKRRKQQLADALAEEAAQIDIDALEGSTTKRRAKPETLSPEEQQAREAAFSQRFTVLKGGAADPEPEGDTVSKNDTVSNIDTVSEMTTVSKNDTVVENDTVSNTDTVPQTPTQKNAPKRKPRRTKKPTPLKAAATEPGIAEVLTRNGNQPVTLHGGYTAVLWSVHDILAPHQTMSEQALYQHLYRLSYGFGNTHCFVGYEKLRQRCQATTNTLKRAVAGLVDKGHIAVLENVNTRTLKGTVYQVLLPGDIKGLKDELEAYEAQRQEGREKASNSQGETLGEGNTSTKTPNTTEEASPQANRLEQGKDDTVSFFDTVSKNDTVSKHTLSKSDTVSEIDTIRTDNTEQDFRTDSTLLEQPPKLKASPVQVENGGDGLVLKDPKEDEKKRETTTATTSSDPVESDQDYIYSRPNDEQGDIFKAQDTWEQWFTADELELPRAAQINEWLQTIRDTGLVGDALDEAFGAALRYSKQQEPRDMMGYLIAGFRKGYLVKAALAA